VGHAVFIGNFQGGDSCCCPK